MKKVLFLDRDGTLIVEPPDEQVDSLEKLEFYPGVFAALSKIASETSYELVIITNQDGLGTDSFPEEKFWLVHNKMIKAFENENIRFSDVLIDRSFAHENRDTRKPGTALLTRYMTDAYDMANSYVIGDRVSDVQLAKNLGAKAILLNDGSLNQHLIENNLTAHCELICTSWHDIYNLISVKPRKSALSRKTNETQVDVKVNLDGTGNSSIATGLGFFDHMLQQVAKHSGVDLSIAVKGDLHVDEHHTIEDTAIALGEAFTLALGNKQGIGRYGFCLPMDDCLAQVAVDFGGRAWLEWSATFRREKIGDMPTEMFFHFFKSFSDAAKCNINIKAEGTNEHHKIESIFKAFARSVKMGLKREGNEIPSTKGVL